jgi:hypothetical protein
MRRVVIAFVVLVLAIYAVLTSSDKFNEFYLKQVAYSMGYRGDLIFKEITDGTYKYSLYKPGSDIISMGWLSREALAHEISHDMFYKLVYENPDKEANELFARLKKCKLGGISDYSDYYRCFDHKSCLLAYDETLAMVAYRSTLLFPGDIPEEWLNIYQDIRAWYLRQQP